MMANVNQITNNHCISERHRMYSPRLHSHHPDWIDVPRFGQRVYNVQYTHKQQTHMPKLASNQIFSWIFIFDLARTHFHAVMFSCSFFSQFLFCSPILETDYFALNISSFSSFSFFSLKTQLAPLLLPSPLTPLFVRTVQQKCWEFVLFANTEHTQWNHVREPTQTIPLYCVYSNIMDKPRKKTDPK